MSDTPKHSVSVAGVVIDSAGRVLVIRRRDNGHWEPPGGVLELGESFEAGVRREVLEETGISIIVGALTGVYKNVRMGVVALVFRCTPTDTAARTSSETSSVAWMDPAEAGELMDPAYAVRVADALRAEQHTITRTHDGVNLVTS